MRFLVRTIILTLTIVTVALPQSGRKSKLEKTSPPPLESPAVPTPSPSAPVPVTTDRNEEYWCTDNGTPARVMDHSEETEPVFTTKTVDVKAYISERPKPRYTEEARRARIQGYVIVKVVLRSNGELGTIQVIRGLPGGLTESAIRAACKIRFKPAIKDRKEVTQMVQVEYGFRLSDSLIYETPRR
jgi:protein TonB